MSKPIKIGVVGLGRIGMSVHRSCLKARPDKFEVVAACDLIPERYQKFQKEFGISFFEKYGKITEEFIKGGFLKKTEKEVAFTDKGFEVSNSILEKYI